MPRLERRQVQSPARHDVVVVEHVQAAQHVVAAVAALQPLPERVGLGVAHADVVHRVAHLLARGPEAELDVLVAEPVGRVRARAARQVPHHGVQLEHLPQRLLALLGREVRGGARAAAGREHEGAGRQAARVRHPALPVGLGRGVLLLVLGDGAVRVLSLLPVRVEHGLPLGRLRAQVVAVLAQAVEEVLPVPRLAL